jgi:hypothetical protein
VTCGGEQENDREGKEMKGKKRKEKKRKEKKRKGKEREAMHEKNHKSVIFHVVMGAEPMA